MRLRGSLAFFLPLIAHSTHLASAQSTAGPQSPTPATTTHRVSTTGVSRFELQRMLTEIDERRRRLRSALDPADSVLHLFAADTLRIAAAARPLLVEDDSANVHDLFVQLRQNPASHALRTQLIAAIDAAANDFTSIEAALATRIAKPQVARDFLERSPFAAVVTVPQARPLENTRLNQLLRVDGPLDRLPRAYIVEFQAALSDSAFRSYRSQLLGAFSSRTADVRALMKADRDEDARLQQDAADVSRAIGARQDDQARLDAHIVMFAVPAVCLAFIGLLLAPLLYRSEDSRRSIITTGMLVELTTVFLLTVAVIILGVDGRIQAEIIGTLLGGVSGYVLGRAVNPPARA